MKEMTIKVTEKQEEFLKLFAEKKGMGKDDNRLTYNPLHVVQTQSFDVLPYSEDIEEYYDRKDIHFAKDSDYDDWFENEVEVIRDWYNKKEEGYPIEIKTFEEARYTSVNGFFIENHTDYFEAYGVEALIALKIERYSDVAHFFVYEEAKKYMIYQKHNLTNPRIDTVSPGYGNEGGFNYFYDLLHDIGVQLNHK